MTKIINLTEHPVNIVDDYGIILETFPGTSNPARLPQRTVVVGMVNGIPLSETQFDYSQATNLPVPQKDTMYIVSRMIREAFKEREDLLVPNEIVRSEDRSTILGAKSLAIN